VYSYFFSLGHNQQSRTCTMQHMRV